MEALHAATARALLEIGAVGFSPENPITFKSGIRSPVYVDNRILPFHPAQWRIVIEGFQAVITAESLAFDALAGVAVGGIPHSAALAYAIQRPSVFVRKEAKGHGKGKQVEGGSVAGRRVLLVEDLVTTGASSLEAVAALRDEGAVVADLLAIVSYGFAEAAESFAAAGVRLLTLTNFRSIIHEARQMGKLTEGQIAVVNTWFHDPYTWGRA